MNESNDGTQGGDEYTYSSLKHTLGPLLNSNFSFVCDCVVTGELVGQ